MMSSLPSFSSPPLWEVAIAVQFAQLSEMHVAHFGRLWEKIHDRYPKTEEQPTLDVAVETFGEEIAPPGPTFEVLQSPPIPRVWFLSTDETELVQIQQDRFIRNWRRISGKEEYPRYTHLIARFLEDFAQFRSFAEEESIGSIIPVQYELTYINHISGEHLPDRNFNVDRVLSIVVPEHSVEFGPDLEDSRIALRYAIRDENGSQVGRLYVAVDPAIRLSDGDRILRMSLTARIIANGSGLAQISSAFDQAHEVIVEGFSALTSAKMHEVWGRQDAD